MINDANADHDTITGLRASTNFGRDAAFQSIRKLHAPTDAGVFYCGPKASGKSTTNEVQSLLRTWF